MTRTRAVARLALRTAGVSLLWLALGSAAGAQTSGGPDPAAVGAPAVKKPAPAARPASARPAAASEDSASASFHLSRAAELYNNGLFDEVVPELQAAYHLNPLPRILCNIAQSYRKGGHPKEAAEQYDLCLRTDPKLTPQERADFAEYRQQALATTAAEDAAAAAASEPPHPDPVPTAAVAAVVVAPSPPVAPPPAAPRPIYKRAWFWGVLGTVVAAGAVTAGILAWQLSKPDPLSLLPPDTPLLRF